MEKVVFEYKGWTCTVEEDEHGFWGAASKMGKAMSHIFPEQTLGKEIDELIFSIDEQEENE